MIEFIKRFKQECKKCGYEWSSLKKNPKYCPKCCNPKFNEPRKYLIKAVNS